MAPASPRAHVRPCRPPSPRLPPGVTQGATVDGITEYTLANGLRVLLFPDPSRPKTTVNVTYLVGSRMENYGETGMAHLLEHMVFKGTPTSGNIMAALAQRGMSFNGSTSYDRTNYFETFTASDDNLDWALAMEADRMVNSKIARADLDTEMTVVRNEMEKGETDPCACLSSARQRRDSTGTTTARTRSARAPTSSASTSAACRPSIASTTSRTTR